MKAFLVFALTFPTLAVFSYFHFASGAEATRFWYGLSKVVQFSLPLVAVFVFKEKRHWNMKFSGGELARGIGSGLAFTALLLILYFLIQHYPFIAGTKGLIEAKLGDFGVSTLLQYFFLSAFIAIAHSFLEEYFWRGFVFAELTNWLSVRIAYFLSALGFMGHHVVVIYKYCPPDQLWLVPVFSAFVFVAGLFWAWQFTKNRSLAGAWISHFFADVAILLIGAHLVFGGL